MNPDDFSLEASKKLYEAYLRRKGLELDEFRLKVLKAALSFHLHFRPEDLAGQIGGEPDVEKLVQVLEELCDAGLMRKVITESGKPSYEHVIGHLHHDHLVCLKCGRVQEFYEPAIERLQEEVSRRYRYHLVRHSHTIYGLCPECARKYAHEFTPLMHAPPLEGDEIPLSMVPAGKKVRLVAVRGGFGLCRRLAEMGINVGDEFEVVHNAFAGQFVIKLKGTKLALGQGMVHKMIVREVSDGEGE